VGVISYEIEDQNNKSPSLSFDLTTEDSLEKTITVRVKNSGEGDLHWTYKVENGKFLRIEYAKPELYNLTLSHGSEEEVTFKITASNLQSAFSGLSNILNYFNGKANDEAVISLINTDTGEEQKIRIHLYIYPELESPEITEVKDIGDYIMVSWNRPDISVSNMRYVLMVTPYINN